MEEGGRQTEEKAGRAGWREGKEISEKGMSKTKYQQPTMGGATHPNAHRAIQPRLFTDQTKVKS